MVEPENNTFLNTVKINAGREALAHIPFELAAMGAERPLLITTKVLGKKTAIPRVIDGLRGAGVPLGIYDDVGEHARLETVLRLAELFQDGGFDAIIALGAGIRVPEYSYAKEVKGPKELVDTITFLAKIFRDRARKPDKILENMRALVSRSGKPIIGVAIGTEATHKKNLERFQVVSYPTPERGVRVLRQMYKYSRFLNSPPTT